MGEHSSETRTADRPTQRHVAPVFKRAGITDLVRACDVFVCNEHAAMPCDVFAHSDEHVARTLSSVDLLSPRRFISLMRRFDYPNAIMSLRSDRHNKFISSSSHHTEPQHWRLLMFALSTRIVLIDNVATSFLTRGRLLDDDSATRMG